MKSIVLLFIFSLTTVLLSAQSKQTLSGTITDSEGTSLPGASVFVEKTKIGTVSDFNGKYAVELRGQNTYTIKVSFIGFETLQKTVTIGEESAELNFKLKENTILSDEVIVRSIRASDKMPVVSQTLDTDKLKETNSAQDIPYLLSLTPSFVSSSETGTGIGYTSMRIRGIDPSRINVTVNGIPVNDSESQSVYWVNMPDFASSVNDVQIQRGVGTSTNGPAAFGATVNFRTSGIEKEAYGELGTAIGSYDTYLQSVKLGTGLINNHFTFDMRYSKLNAGAYIDHGFSDHQSLFLSGAYYSPKTMVKANVLTGDQHTGITWWGVPDYMIDSIRTYNPAGEYYDDKGKQQYYEDQTDNYKQTHFQLFFAHEFDRSLNINVALHSTLGKGYYEQYKAEEDLTEYGFPTDGALETDLIRQKWLDNVFGGVVYSLNYSKNKLDLNFGGGYNRYEGDHFGNIIWVKNNPAVPKDYEWYNNVGKKNELSSYLKGAYTLYDNKLSVFGDIQYRMINYQLTGNDDDLTDLTQEHDYDFVNPKAGIKYQHTNKLSVYGSFGIANREPTRTDIKEATRSDAKTFPTYETLQDYEFGANYKSQFYSIGANFYYMEYKDQLVHSGKLNSVGNAIMRNVPDSYRMGVELIGGLQVFKDLQWEANITLSENIIENHTEFASYSDVDWNEEYIEKSYGNTQISFSPSVIASSVLSYRRKGARVSFATKYVGSQYYDNTMSDLRKLDAYFVNNLHLAYQYQLKNIGTFDIQLSINNLFSEKYISNAYGGQWFEENPEKAKEYIEKSWSYYYPQAPRHYMLKVNFAF